MGNHAVPRSNSKYEGVLIHQVKHQENGLKSGLVIREKYLSSRQEKIVLIGHFADTTYFSVGDYGVFRLDRVGQKKGKINRYESSK